MVSVRLVLFIDCFPSFTKLSMFLQFTRILLEDYSDLTGHVDLYFFRICFRTSLISFGGVIFT